MLSLAFVVNSLTRRHPVTRRRTLIPMKIR
ncbi:hypothetical protein JOE60_003445 [Paenarthrobacter ilicis]|uniref:Uncharacterized protein n=1 Tax=Paenarthrobacter ilicis TaxID=43665 RepID=A0ABX0TK41_9MICC|nr:hypothetical protein [Paenarthrobacter ilicis]NIJ02847.1 hypothetical protein [Paenarthrobacter ilicis]